MRRVLIVTPRFAPVNAADMHRVRQSLPYFHEYGWEPVVLAVDPRQCETPLDPLLIGTVPEDVRIVRTRAFDLQKTRWFGLGDLGLRTLPFLARAGDRLLAEEHFDVVYFSTTAFSLMALGARWQRRSAVPFVLDLQDPWLSDYYDQPGAPAPPGGRFKYMLSQSLARVLEPHTIRHASHVISVSPRYPEMLMQRYAWLRPEQFTVLPFGAPEVDFELLHREPVSHRVFNPADGFEHWVYVGAAGEIMRFALEAFFLALRRTRNEQPERFARLRLHFVGTDYAAGKRARKTVQPVAEACGVADLVEERPHRIPYFEALQCLLDANALIVPGSDDPGYTASKLYPYILARKPLLAVFHEQSSVTEVLRKTCAGTVVPFASGEAAETVAARISSVWFDQLTHSAPETDWGVFEQYTAREMTRRQCEVFDNVVAYQAKPEMAYAR